MVSLANKHLVIFGCGYVGSAVAREAVAQGARVTALTRNPDKAAVLRESGVSEVVIADLAGDDWHRSIPAGADFVLNSVSSGGGGIEGYRHSYAGGMRSILAWAARGSQPIGTLLYTSSTSVYPQGRGVVVDESAKVAGSTAAGEFLLDAENQLRSAPVSKVGRGIVLRLAGIYGPDRHHLLDQVRAGAETMGGGAHRLNLAHRDDIVAAILACFRAPATASTEVFNVADDAPAPKEEVIRWLAGQLGRPVPRFETTASPRRGGEPAPDRIISNAKLKTQLGWQPRFPSFREGYENLLSR
jgi:nucleoside-diphosphate-sugar epimerase